MSISNFDDLMVHFGHEVVIAKYGNANEVFSVGIECLDCCEVLVSYEKYEEEYILEYPHNEEDIDEEEEE